jgi:hypothetical protein
MLSPSPCSLLPAPMQPQPEILAYWTGSLGVFLPNHEKLA